MTPEHELITIPISHYCDKARWGLDRAGVPYVERAHVPVFHYVPAQRAAESATVPVLTTPMGPLAESTAILRYADWWAGRAELFPPDAPSVTGLVDTYDEFGVHTRLLAYHRLLPHPKLLVRFGATGVPGWQRRLLPLAVRGLRRLITRRLKIDDRSVQRARVEVARTMDDVASRLSDGRRWLAGDRFTAADIAFAAMAAPLIMPAEYGVPLPQPADLPHETATWIESHRGHDAGRFALRMYREER